MNVRLPPVNMVGNVQTELMDIRVIVLLATTGTTVETVCMTLLLPLLEF